MTPRPLSHKDCHIGSHSASSSSLCQKGHLFLSLFLSNSWTRAQQAHPLSTSASVSARAQADICSPLILLMLNSKHELYNLHLLPEPRTGVQRDLFITHLPHATPSAKVEKMAKLHQFTASSKSKARPEVPQIPKCQTPFQPT